ncbi:MAG TPA: hypothetical protein VKT77_23570 [Chthonomonadaceae bacterium]|nr:hypothetical protein [Chthonomonadaceae bacterium]
MRNITPILSVLFILSRTAARAAAIEPVATPPAPCYRWIGREKIRAGYMSAADLGPALAKMRAAGMNALLPKFGGLQSPPSEQNLKDLAAWGAAARSARLHLLPVFNFRGGDTERIPNDRREVTAIGRTMEKTPCPLDERFWDRYVRDRMAALAEHARELGIDGAVLDPEMYGADHLSYDSVCYCPDCMREFFQATGQSPPNPLPRAAERADWLRRNGLQRRYEERFAARVEELCRRVEKACHAKSPEFLIGTLHPDLEGPFTRALAAGLGTERYPLLGFSERTYSPGYTDFIDRQQRIFAAAGAHVLFVPGIWQQQFPTENLAEQYYACAAHASGYWVYTIESLAEDTSRNPGYSLREPLDRYWAAIKTADDELDRLRRSGGRYVSALRVRPFDPPLPVLTVRDIAVPHLLSAPTSGTPLARIFLPRTRYRSIVFIRAAAGEPIEAKVTNVQLANYRPGTQWVLTGPNGQRLAEGHMRMGESDTVRYTPLLSGTYVLVADSGSNSHRIELISGQRYASPASVRYPFTVNGQFGRMYFYVPKGVEEFRFTVEAEGQAPGRGGKITVTDPDGAVAARVAGDLDPAVVTEVRVPPAAQGRVWRIAAEDVTNDLRLFFAPDFPAPYLSPDLARVLTPRL